MRLFELYDHDLSRSEISKLIRKEIDRTGEDAWHVNNGWCWIFANKIAKILGPKAKVVNSTTDYKDGTFPGHSWIEYKGYHFDAESPFGELEPKQMQYHRRMRAIADSPHDQDEEEAVVHALGHKPIYHSKRNYR